MLHRHSFRLEINSLEEFKEFCELLRDDTLDDERLQALADKLHRSADALAKAQERDRSRGLVSK
jgi:benzoyl-CoA reductase/2-hydroxyglutaryl-CoA dehydratase subunit BcrC/BadD/HgdB